MWKSDERNNGWYWNDDGLGPVLGGVIDAGDFHGVLLNLINDDIWEWRKNQFAAAFHTTQAATVGEVLQRRTPFDERGDGLTGGSGVIGLDPVENAFQIEKGFRRPPHFHFESQDWKSCLTR